MISRAAALQLVGIYLSASALITVGLTASAGTFRLNPRQQSARSAPVLAEPWQRSWEAYVDAYNACVKDSTCKASERFGKKRVQWEATLVELDLKSVPQAVKLSLKSSKGFDVSKPPTVFEIIAPEMRTAAVDAWKAVPLGSTVRFDALIEEGGGIFAGFGMVGARFQDAFPLPRAR